MHFSIPDTQEINENQGSSSYVGYNVCINGNFHCTVRYKQLHNLNEQLKKIHGCHNIPPFPPKRILPLSASQLEERRCLLEKYIQTVGQMPQLMDSDVFTGFWLFAQMETSGEQNREIPINAFLMNGYRISVICNIWENSSRVLEKVCLQINLPITYIYYFAMFLVGREENGDITVVRKLQDFESPYISQKSVQQGACRIVLRKSYWDPAYNEDLSADQVALNLLYVQAVSDLDRGWIVCSKDTQMQMASLQARGNKKEYLDMACRLPHYGYLQFKPCKCDYPVPDTNCVVRAGHRELCLQVMLAGGDTRDSSFKVTRMRCWRITTHTDTKDGDEQRTEPTLELSFEYLIAREKLQWISVFSDQAILMSVCLQDIVDELLLKRNGLKIKRPCEPFKTGVYNYMKRDGSHHQVSLSQSSSFDCLASPTNDHASSPTKCSEPTLSMRRLSQKLSSVNLKNKSQPLVENDAFEEIGDDDL